MCSNRIGRHGYSAVVLKWGDLPLKGHSAMSETVLVVKTERRMVSVSTMHRTGSHPNKELSTFECQYC
jgi:hypothetical protein